MQTRKSLYEKLKAEYHVMLHTEVEKYPHWGARLIKTLQNHYYVIDTPWGAINDLQKLTKVNSVNPYELFEDED